MPDMKNELILHFDLNTPIYHLFISLFPFSLPPFLPRYLCWQLLPCTQLLHVVLVMYTSQCTPSLFYLPLSGNQTWSLFLHPCTSMQLFIVHWFCSVVHHVEVGSVWNIVTHAKLPSCPHYTEYRLHQSRLKKLENRKDEWRNRGNYSKYRIIQILR